jgi:hypothetical protein
VDPLLHQPGNNRIDERHAGNFNPFGTQNYNFAAIFLETAKSSIRRDFIYHNITQIT